MECTRHSVFLDRLIVRLDMDIDEDVIADGTAQPPIQGLDKHIIDVVIPSHITNWALPPGVTPLEAPVKPRIDPWDFFRTVLKNPKHIMAPMVDGSDLSYRLLSRRYNTHVTFTPMIHSYALPLLCSNGFSILS